VWVARAMLADDLAKLVITFSGYKVDLEFMPTARQGMIVIRMGYEMYTVYTGVYCHLKCSSRLFRKGTTVKNVN
jgi:hypothetical protein